MDMKRILQAMDGVATKPVEGASSMKRFLQVVKEAELNQVAQPAPAAPAPAPAAPAPAASTLSPEQLAYNQLRAQLDSADALRGGANNYTDVSPEVTASTNAMRTKLAQMAAALKAKGIDAAAEYDAPDPAVPAAAPVDLNQKYTTEETGMSRLLSIISEGTNPHKVALPVQMAMQHYAKPAEIKVTKPSLLKGYLSEVHEEVAEETAHKRQLMNQYAQTIAERVLMRESKLEEKSKSEKQARFMAAAAHDPQFAARTGIKQSVAKEFNKADTGTKQLSQAMKKKKKVNEAPIDMTGDPNDPTVYGHQQANPMSLKGRIMSARAQLKELAELAESDELVVWEKITRLSKGGMFMGLEQNLEQIRHGISELAAKRKQGGVSSRGIDKNIGEDNDPCWDSHKMVGTKKKGGKTVPNCVPKE
jgi:hypothetical protein